MERGLTPNVMKAYARGLSLGAVMFARSHLRSNGKLRKSNTAESYLLVSVTLGTVH